MSAETEKKSIVSPSTWMESLDHMLAKENFVTDALDKLEKKTNIKKRYVAIAILTIISVYLVIGYSASLLCNTIGFVYPAYISLLWMVSDCFASLVCNAIGFIYPAYKSVKAIESKEKDDDTEWLMYWVVFALFSVCEFFSDIFLSWFPFYYLAKCLFLIWCMAPASFNGSYLIYYKFIRPFVLRNEVTIDDTLNKVGGKAKQLADEAKDAATTVAAGVIAGTLKKDE